MATEVPRYLINTPGVGAFVEGLGVLKEGNEYDLPEEIVVSSPHHPKSDKDGRRTIIIEPRETWWPMNEAAWAMFEKYKRVPKTKNELNVLFKDESAEDVELAAKKKAEQEEKFRRRFAELRKRHAAGPQDPVAPTPAPADADAGSKKKGRAADQAQ